MTALQNFRATSGDTITITVTVTDSAGAAVDLTGASIRWSARKLGEADNAIEKTTSAGEVELTDPTAGEFEVVLEPADTASLAGVYQHESEITDVAGGVTTVATGAMTLTEDVIL